MSSTRSINTDLEMANENTPLISQKADPKKALIHMQAAFNLINTFTKVTYTSATLATDILGLPASVIGLSPYALGASIPFAVLFALAEVHSHHAQSDHFNHADTHHSAPASDKKSNHPLSWKQSVSSAIHYLSDTYEGAAVPLLISKLAGIDQASSLVRSLTYTGSLLFSAAGTAQEFVNTRVAFSQQNAREVHSRAMTV